ncbi:MAG: ABC transporter permease [Acidimicrobiales bacterium]
MRRALPRAAQYLLVLWAASTLNFLLPHMAPGDPVDYLFSGEASAALPEESRRQLRADYGVDGSLLEQYGRYWASLATGDLGVSVRHSRPVTEVLLERLPWTLALVGIAGLTSALIGTLAGVAAAWRRGGRRDVGLVSGVLALDAMPGFWIGMLLISVFAVQLGWLPSFGAVPLSMDEGRIVWLVDVARRLVLPVATITLATLGGTFLLARASMLSTLGQPYILMAEAKGVPSRRIAYRHALRNALLPVATNVMLGFGVLLSGAVVVETVFSYPGLGRLVYDAVIERDYPLLRGAFLLLTLGVVAANLVADLCYPLLDPRVRRSGREQG